MAIIILPMIWEFYRQAYTIRRTEETLLDLFSKGLLFGTVHTCIGQEPGAVGVISALDRSKDVIWSNHRGHGHFLAFSDDVEGLIAEVMGRETGVCGGIGGTQHLHKDNFYTNGILGGTVPCAVGSAMAEKAAGSGAITCVFIGDGAMAEGVVYESMNLAALWDLPVLFVLEHNGIAQTTPSHLAHAGSMLDRPKAFGIESRALDGLDVEKIHEAAVQAVSYVRSNNRPFFLQLNVLRLMPHSKGDDTRTDQELADLLKRDPVLQFSQRLDALDAARRSEIEAAVNARIAAAVEKALKTPFMDLTATTGEIA